MASARNIVFAAAIAAASVAFSLPAAAQRPTLDPNGTPNYGTFTDASRGLHSPVGTPDLRVLPLRAGGPVNAANVLTGNVHCKGYVTRNPDVRYNYIEWPASMQNPRLDRPPLIFKVTSTADTTLIIRNPQGRWICIDDYQGQDPTIAFRVGMSGRYDIWIGTFSPGQPQLATLRIYETFDW